MSRRRLQPFLLWCVPLLTLVWLGASVSAQDGVANGEWRYYGGDAGSNKYSPLDQINRNNFEDLQIAWRWRTDNLGPRPDYNLQATPLMVDGVLFTTAGSRRSVAAIDAATGETLWLYRLDEGSRGANAPTRAVSGRGVAYWSDGTEERILHVTQGYHLVALDAQTGHPIGGFGEDGVVDLFQELDRPQPPAEGRIGWNSPPIVVRDTIVIGAAFGGRGMVVPPTVGHIRGYDVRTGERRWIFHTVPGNDEFGRDTWEDGSAEIAGNVGAWAAFSADEELGYVYVPVEAALTDRIGQARPGDNLFSETLVCLDARTGERIWHFQLAHHGLWDYDPPAPPVLLDVRVDGRQIKAVAQVTKQAFAFVFDRVTGEPVWPIEERPVPQSDVPGEKTSPTQPFPTKPAPFDRQGLSVDDAIDFTPELKAEALELMSQYRIGPMYTPPSLIDPNGTQGTMFLPGQRGGANWPGAAADPETGILYVGSVAQPVVSSVRPCPEGRTPTLPGMTYCGGVFYPAIQGGLPPIKPPWGRITAIDLNTGEHLWWVPNADAPDFVKNHPALEGVELPRTGRQDRVGILVTKTLLIAGEGGGLFAAGPNSGGPILRAYDKRTGDILSEFELPAHQTGVPMTYMLGGQQYIVVAVGARDHPAELVALTLP